MWVCAVRNGMRLQLISAWSACALVANCFSAQEAPTDSIGQYKSTGPVGASSTFDSAAGDSRSGSGGTKGADGGNSPHKQCAEACSQDSDCLVDIQDQGFQCNATTSRCERYAEPCLADAECIPSASLWFLDCTSDADCFLFSGESCVDVAGAGKCARRADQNDAGSDACEFPVPDPITVFKFGSSETIVVCADASRKCHDGTCIISCVNAPCTPDTNGSVCNSQTGLCECVRDEDCRGPGVSHCNTETRRCECARDSDCDIPNTDSCVAGSCGCSSRTACRTERKFATTTYVCE